jgi:NADH:ubiquinone oxidoreductase subunit F (NADH-binding)
MQSTDILEKLKKANLLGKGGASFPVATKWEGAGNAPGDIKYVICNSSEGELGLFKDLYIWRHHMDLVFDGIRYALDFLGKAEAYIHINENYWLELQPSLFNYINNYRWLYDFHISVEKPSYVGGEASALLNFIETGIAQPKPRIQRTVVKGLFDKPTLMQNVETFYDIARVLTDNYDECRFVCIYGKGIKQQVVRTKIETTVAEILKEAKVQPNFDYFVQVGGSASGAVYSSGQLANITLSGMGALEIFDRTSNNLLVFLRRLAIFFQKEACGKCSGKKFASELLQLLEAVNSADQLQRQLPQVLSLVENMYQKTFCHLCKSLKTPVITYCQNILELKDLC